MLGQRNGWLLTGCLCTTKSAVRILNVTSLEIDALNRVKLRRY